MLHIDTTWKFREMIEFRDQMADKYQIKLMTHTNQDGVRDGVTPFSTTASEYTRVMKTVALRQALDSYGFDAAIVVRAAMRRKVGRKRDYLALEKLVIAGIQERSGQSFGEPTIQESGQIKACEYFQFQIGLNLISGAISSFTISR